MLQMSLTELSWNVEALSLVLGSAQVFLKIERFLSCFYFQRLSLLPLLTSEKKIFGSYLAKLAPKFIYLFSFYLF